MREAPPSPAISVHLDHHLLTVPTGCHGGLCHFNENTFYGSIDAVDKLFAIDDG